MAKGEIVHNYLNSCICFVAKEIKRNLLLFSKSYVNTYLMVRGGHRYCNYFLLFGHIPFKVKSFWGQSLAFN